MAFLGRLIVIAFALADKVYLLERARTQAHNDHLIAEQQQAILLEINEWFDFPEATSREG